MTQSAGVRVPRARLQNIQFKPVIRTSVSLRTTKIRVSASPRLAAPGLPEHDVKIAMVPNLWVLRNQPRPGHKCATCASVDHCSDHPNMEMDHPV